MYPFIHPHTTYTNYITTALIETVLIVTYVYLPKATTLSLILPEKEKNFIPVVILRVALLRSLIHDINVVLAATSSHRYVFHHTAGDYLVSSLFAMVCFRDYCKNIEVHLKLL